MPRQQVFDEKTKDNDVCDQPSTQPPVQLRVYKIRWFYLAIICLANISNAVNWICYSSVSNYTSRFYAIDLTDVNWLSLVFLVTSTPMGFVSCWLTDTVGFRLSINLGAWLNFVGALLRTFSSFTLPSGGKLVPVDAKYAVLLTGQTLCSLAQPFIMFITTKFAATWFAENQRALANTLALSSNMLGVLVGAFISSLITASVPEAYAMNIMNLAYCILSVVPALLACFIFRSSPKMPASYSKSVQSQKESRIIEALSANGEPYHNENEYNFSASQTYSTPVSTSATSNSRYCCQHLLIYLKESASLFRSAQFVGLLLCFGLGCGMFNTLLTLIEQIICVRGYDSADAGVLSMCMILSGLVGSLIAGIVLDRTKQYDRMCKFYVCLCAIFNILFAILQSYDNRNVAMRPLLIVLFCLFGFVALPLLPIMLETAVECTYPAVEATSSGLMLISGQLFGIFMILVYPLMAFNIEPTSYTHIHVQRCFPVNVTAEAIKPSHEAVTDFKYPLYGQSGLFLIVAILFGIFFKCPTLRLNAEKEEQQAVSVAAETETQRTEILV